MVPAAPFGGRFAFDPPAALFGSGFLGEVVLEPSARDARSTYFILRLVGRTRNQAIQMRQYEGRAFLRGELLELRGERCYLFGKRSLETKLVPQERWDCDHLIFSFRSPNGFRARAVLFGLATPRSRYSDWLGRFDLVPLPAPDGAPLSREVQRGRDAFFAGRVFEVLPKGEVVVWGHRAGYLLKPGQVLTATKLGGGPTCQLRVKSHPEHFLITELLPGCARLTVGRAWVVYTLAWPKSEGLFSWLEPARRVFAVDAAARFFGYPST